MRRSFVFWSLDWNQSRQLANGGQGDKERERGAAPMRGGCGFPSCLEGGQTPGNCTRSESTPQTPAFFSAFLRGEPSVCNGFSSPETVVLLHQTLLNPQPGDSSSAAPEPAPPTRPVPPSPAPRLCPHQPHQQPPPTHPDPASQLRREREREREGERERAKYLRKRGGGVPIRTALPSGWGQADREGERKERGRERKRSTGSGRGGSERSLLCPSLAPSRSRLRSPRLPPSAPSLSLLLSPRSEHPS